MSLDYSLHCAWCDQRCRDRSDLIAHEAQHRHDTELRPSAEQLASGLERAAAAGRVPRDTIVTVNSGGDGICDMTFGDFLDANADGIDEEETKHIALTLAEGMTYRGGGGAEAQWTVKVA